MKKLSKRRVGSSRLHSVSDAARLLTQTAEESSTVSKDLVLQVACIVLERLIYETCSSDRLYLAFSSAKSRIENLDNKEEALEIFEALVLMADKTYKTNPFRRFFGT
jgi:hypothetical protein